MKRWNRLIATAAALFVLQAPLCVLACLPSANPEAETAETHQAPSCHEQAPSSESSSSTSEPVESDAECGCESAYTAVLASADPTFSLAAQNLVVVPPHAMAAPLEAVLVRTSKVRSTETDLPPPDILLLKSTLLI